MSNSKTLILLCLLASALIGTGCGTDHPDLKQGETLGVDDLLGNVESATGQSGEEGGGQLIGGPSGNAGGSGGTGGGGAAAACGNGRIETGEQCDGASLGTASCAQLGMTGTLLCDPTTCTIDDSMCFSGAGGVGGSP